MRAEYDKALKCYHDAFNIGGSGDPVSQMRLMINIGVVHYKLKNYARALNVFNDVLSLQKRYDWCLDRDLLLLNMAHAYAYLGNYDSALNYIDQGLQACRDGCTPAIRMQAHFVKGVTYLGLKDLAQSEDNFLSSYQRAS